MPGSVVYKIRGGVKRVEYKEKLTTRGTRFRQTTVKTRPSPSHSPSKLNLQFADVETFEQDGFDEPLIRHKGKVSLPVNYDKVQEVDPTFRIQSQNDYLREFSHVIDNILDVVLQMEAPMDDGICSSCGACQTMWKCSDCVGCTNLCNACVKVRHSTMPYHRVQHWTGKFFEPAWLCQANVLIHLGHGGLPCPSNTAFDTDVASDSGHSTQPPQDDTIFGNGLPKFKGRDYHVVVDKSGVHRIRIIPCRCANAAKESERYVHYLHMGLFPASLQNIKTVFTFAVLDDFRMENLECKTAGLNYWHKLARITSNEFPKSVPVSVWLS